MARLRKGDLVAVLSGKDRGKRGKLLRMVPDKEAALVERLNLAKHFEKRTQPDRPSGILEREAPIRLDKLAIVCPRCDRPTRIGWNVTEGGAKQRTCKRCHEVLGG